ncbi:type II toxin-antitoxin system VapC family toxin [soil metagenome]
MDEVVADASALVDLLLANELGQKVRLRLTGHQLHAPAHVDAEVLSAMGRLHRAGDLAANDVETCLASLASAPITKHAVSDLLLGAWARRHRLRLADALYVELATTLGCPLVTTDRRLHDMPVADVVSP